MHQVEGHARQILQQVAGMLDRTQVQGLAMAIAERVGTAIHMRLQQVDTTFDGDQIEGVDMPGMGVQRQILQVHGMSSGEQSYTKIYTNTIFVQSSKSTRHKANRPSVLQRPGGGSRIRKDQLDSYLVSLSR